MSVAVETSASTWQEQITFLFQYASFDWLSHDMSEIKKVPYKLKFDPETLHMCTKLSGKPLQYSTREEFHSIVKFLSARWGAISGFILETDVPPGNICIRRIVFWRQRTETNGRWGLMTYLPLVSPTFYLGFFSWQVWVANDDKEVEGVWRNWFTDQVDFVKFLPIRKKF